MLTRNFRSYVVCNGHQALRDERYNESSCDGGDGDYDENCGDDSARKNSKVQRLDGDHERDWVRRRKPMRMRRREDSCTDDANPRIHPPRQRHIRGLAQLRRTMPVSKAA